MNTKQMVALWYTGLAAVLALVMYADSVMAYSPRKALPILPVLACIGIIGALLLGTFQSSEEVDSKRVLLYSLGPPAGAAVLLMGIAWVAALYSGEQGEATSVGKGRDAQKPSQLASKVEIVDPCLRFEDSAIREGKLAILEGRIRNRATDEIESITVNVRIHEHEDLFDMKEGECSGWSPSPTDSVSKEIDGHVFQLDVDVPPQETRSFTSETGHMSAPTMRPPEIWEWTFELQSVSTGYN